MEMTAESECLARISAHLDENKRKMALEVERLQNLDFEAKREKMADKAKSTASESWRLDFIYDNESLVFENNPLNELQKMQAQDPLEEINLGDGVTKRPMYISTKVGSKMKVKLIEVLKEYKDCFAWNYGEMPGLDRSVDGALIAYSTWKKASKVTSSTICSRSHYKN